MRGKKQEAVLAVLDGGSEYSSKDIALMSGVNMRQICKMLLIFEKRRIVKRVSGRKGSTTRPIIWRILTEDDLFLEKVEKLPAGWSCVDPVVWNAVKAMCEVRS